MKIATAAERPELAGPAWEATKDTLPEYNHHGDVLNEYWPRLTAERPDFQFHLVGEDDEILARARSVLVLKPCGVRVIGAHMLDEQGLAAGAQHPPQFPQCPWLVVDPAQDQRGHGHVEVVVVERKVLGRRAGPWRTGGARGPCARGGAASEAGVPSVSAM